MTSNNKNVVTTETLFERTVDAVRLEMQIGFGGSRKLIVTEGPSMKPGQAFQPENYTTTIFEVKEALREYNLRVRSLIAEGFTITHTSTRVE